VVQSGLGAFASTSQIAVLVTDGLDADEQVK
jgi:hypothetical protein